MNWKPISLDELESLVDSDLTECSEELRTYFAVVRITPTKWTQSPWGDEVGGFWAVAVDGNRVLWYNDIEEGFNVSCFMVHGEIPTDEYWSNQDPLCWALPRLQGDLGIRLGPQQPPPDPDTLGLL